MITITDGKGFHLQFPNGYIVSVQIGGGNYCDNYDKPVGNPKKTIKSSTAEVAVISPQKELIDIWKHGNTVKGYIEVPKILELLNKVAAL